MDTDSITNKTISIYPPQVYLEIARAISVCNVPTTIEINNETSNFRFGLASIICIYSYMAIESFVNAMLKDLWESAKRNQDCFLKDPLLRKKGAVPKYDDFWKKFCGEKGLDYLWNQELKEKIKILCKTTNKKPLSDAKPQLWDNFLKFLRDSRHFNVHMRPVPNFDEKIQMMLKPEIVSSWSEIVREIILYLTPHFASRKWLKQNILLNIPRAEFLGEKINS